MSRLSKTVFVTWLFACIGLLVWGGYRLPTHCDWTYCYEYPFGEDVGEEEDNPTLLANETELVVTAFGLPTIILAIASGVYFSVRAIHRRVAAVLDPGD